MLLRSSIAGALALALVVTPIVPGGAVARTRAYARLECVGVYCRIVPVLAPRDPLSERRPPAWCGWWLRHQVRRDPGPAFNRARNWIHWGHPTQPAVGAVVVWPHHVGLITNRAADGMWIVRSGNDGNAVRERPMSLARAIAFRTE